MTTPQEPASRIVPFRPRATPTSGVGRRAGHTTPSVLASDQLDQLLSSTPVFDRLPGEGEGLTHVRAVSLGASSGAFYPHTLTEDAPALARKLNLSSIEVMLQTAGEYDAAFVQQVATNARNAGVTVHSVHSLTRLLPFFDAYPRRVTEANSSFRQAIDACVALGAKVLVWHGPNRTEVATDAGWERFISLAHTLATLCGESGVTLGIENVSYGALAQVRNVVNLATRLEEIGTPAEVGFVFDPFQAAEAGANPFMMLAAMGNRVVNVHVSDYREHDPAVRHVALGDGDLPWSALIRAIAGSGYRGPLMIEAPLGQDTTAIARVRQTLEPLIRQVFPWSPRTLR